MANRGCGCKDPTDRRINPDTGVSEVSFDSGVSWEEDLSDPRNTAQVLPLPPGTPLPDASCSGAESASQVLKIIMDKIISETANWDDILALIAGVVAAITALFPPLGVIAGIIGSFVVVIFVLGRTAVVAALDAAAYDALVCALYCHISPDASFSDDGLQGVKNDLTATTPGGVAGLVFWWLVTILGRVFLTNAARMLPNASADCSECGCSCDSPTLGSTGTGLLSRPDLGTGWWQVTTVDGGNPADEPNGRFYAEIVMPACCLHNAYTYDPGLTNAPPGNRMAIDCSDIAGFANYGLGGCQKYILFRAYEAGNITFQILECP